MKLVIVVGCQRSGTTLVGLIVGAHPNAVLIDETDKVYRWFEESLDQWPNEEGPAGVIADRARRKYVADDDRFTVAGDGSVRLSPRVTHLVLQAPNLTYSYAVISRLGVPVSVVYPVRDPRAVVASMAKLAHIPMIENQVHLIRQHPDLVAAFSGDLAQLESADVPDHVKRALIWRIKSGLFDRFASSGVTPLRFRYEDLISDPERYCRDMAAHTGLGDTRGMTEHESQYSGFGPGLTERSRAVDRAPNEAWVRELTPQQQSDVMDVAGELARQFGYA